MVVGAKPAPLLTQNCYLCPISLSLSLSTLLPFVGQLPLNGEAFVGSLNEYQRIASFVENSNSLLLVNSSFTHLQAVPLQLNSILNRRLLLQLGHLYCTTKASHKTKSPATATIAVYCCHFRGRPKSQTRRIRVSGILQSQS